MEKHIYFGVIIADEYRSRGGKVESFTCVAENIEEATKNGNYIAETQVKKRGNYERMNVLVWQADAADIQVLLDKVSDGPTIAGNDGLIIETDLLM